MCSKETSVNAFTKWTVKALKNCKQISFAQLNVFTRPSTVTFILFWWHNLLQDTNITLVMMATRLPLKFCCCLTLCIPSVALISFSYKKLKCRYIKESVGMLPPLIVFIIAFWSEQISICVWYKRKKCEQYFGTSQDSLAFGCTNSH